MTGAAASPALPAPFRADRAERLALPVSYVLAYLYVDLFWFTPSAPLQRLLLTAFTVLFCAGTELLFRREKPSTESFVWLGCLLAVLASIAAGRCRVWGGWSVLFLHGFAVYWLLARSGRLLEGASGRLAPLDLLRGFLTAPFSCFFLRQRVLLDTLRTRRRGSLAAWAATALALVLLAAAVSLLSAADNAFAALTAGLRRLLTVQSIPDVFLELILSLPVGAYLYGLALGTRRTEPAALAARTARLDGTLAKLRRVPETVWCVLTGCFCAVYLLFFAVQGSYLFGAFRHRLPAGFTVAQYARQGFFQLCMVMGVNFLLLWLVTHSSRALNRPGRIMCTVLLAQSILLAVTALSKLALYIACFGFTPLRLQSSWLVCVLLAGCAAWLVSLWTARRTCRAWLLFSGVTLALLCLV